MMLATARHPDMNSAAKDLTNIQRSLTPKEGAVANTCVVASHDALLAEYFEDHFATVLPSLRLANPCLISEDVGNPAIPVVLRAAFVLGTLGEIANPMQFRPAPLAVAPLGFQDPRLSALALAFDFLAFAASARPPSLPRW